MKSTIFIKSHIKKMWSNCSPDFEVNNLLQPHQEHVEECQLMEPDRNYTYHLDKVQIVTIFRQELDTVSTSHLFRLKMSHMSECPCGTGSTHTSTQISSLVPPLTATAANLAQSGEVVGTSNITKADGGLHPQHLSICIAWPGVQTKSGQITVKKPKCSL